MDSINKHELILCFQLLFMFYRHEESNGATVRLELRDDTHDPNEDPVSGAAMWSTLLPLLMDLEELMQTYTGKSYG